MVGRRLVEVGVKLVGPGVLRGHRHEVTAVRLGKRIVEVERRYERPLVSMGTPQADPSRQHSGLQDSRKHSGGGRVAVGQPLEGEMQGFLEQVVTGGLRRGVCHGLGEVLAFQQDRGCILSGQRLGKARNADRTRDLQQRRQPVGIDHEYPVEPVPPGLGIELGDDLRHGGEVGGESDVLEEGAGVELVVARREIGEPGQDPAGRRKGIVERRVVSRASKADVAVLGGELGVGAQIPPSPRLSAGVMKATK